VIFTGHFKPGALNQFARASMQAEAGENLERASKRQKVDLPTAEEMAALERYVNLTIHMDVCNRNYSGYIDVRRKEADFEFWREDQKIKLDSLREQERLKNAQLEIAVDKERTELETTKNHNKIKAEQEMLKLRQANYNLSRLEAQAARDSRKDELLHSQAAKHVQTQPTPQDGGVSQAPTSTTTVLKVYHANREAFPLLRQEQRKSFLVKAGTSAAGAYILQYGVHPKKIDENGHEVNAYPAHAEPLVFQALRSSYRDHAAGASQPTLDSAFFRPAQFAV